MTVTYLALAFQFHNSEQSPLDFRQHMSLGTVLPYIEQASGQMNGFTLGIHYSFYPSVPATMREQGPSLICSWKTRPSLGEKFANR